MIIVANHSHFCWAREHIGQSAVFKKTLNSAQMLAGNGYFTISVPTGTEVGTFDKHYCHFVSSNWRLSSTVLYKSWEMEIKKYLTHNECSSVRRLCPVVSTSWTCRINLWPTGPRPRTHAWCWEIVSHCLQIVTKSNQGVHNTFTLLWCCQQLRVFTYILFNSLLLNLSFSHILQRNNQFTSHGLGSQTKGGILISTFEHDT